VTGKMLRAVDQQKSGFSFAVLPGRKEGEDR
jgi:hypothetical protein